MGPAVSGECPRALGEEWVDFFEEALKIIENIIDHQISTQGSTSAMFLGTIVVEEAKGEAADFFARIRIIQIRLITCWAARDLNHAEDSSLIG